MDIERAMRAAAPDAPGEAVSGLRRAHDQLVAFGALDCSRRAAHLVGQCAHESAGFTRRVENLWFTTPERLVAVWPGRFTDAAAAARHVRRPETLANTVYAGRMGNRFDGDGWRFRGRGWLQLTGRANYRRFGRLIGEDLEETPDRAADPATAWVIAAAYLATRRRAGRTAFEWAAAGDARMVTRIVNGATHGLADRRARTTRALAALEGVSGLRADVGPGDRGAGVAALQVALAAEGLSPGPVDGVYGPRTARALAAFDARATAPFPAA